MKKNSVHLALFFALAFLLTSPLAANAKEPKRGAYFEYGPLETLTSQSLGPEGGSIVFDQKTSPLYGATLTFPAGALLQNTLVTVALQKGRLNLPDGRPHTAPVFKITCGSLHELAQPLTISFPHDFSRSSGGVAYAVERPDVASCTGSDCETGSLEPLTTVAYGQKGGTISAITFRAETTVTTVDH
ncbi:MAG: hypothetical protein WC612_04555 [Bdellovibrionales bacterium]|jgi:hypothetical protein